MSQLIVNNLSLGYDGIVVSEGINFQVNKGDYLCIVGENGSGKSTLMKTLLGLQNRFPGKSSSQADCHAPKSAICRSKRRCRRIFPHLCRKSSCRDFWRL